MNAEVVTSPIPVRCQGYVTNEDGSSCYVYAVFNRAEVEAFEGGEITPENVDDVAHDLTGWTEYYSGPGRGFAHPPSVRLYRHAVLVRQCRGLDI